MLYIFCQYMCSLGIEPTTFALPTQCSTTEPQVFIIFFFFFYLDLESVIQVWLIISLTLSNFVMALNGAWVSEAPKSTCIHHKSNPYNSSELMNALWSDGFLEEKIHI